MAKSIRHLISQGSDEELFIQTCQRLHDCHRDQLNISSLPPEHRTIMLVEFALGSIGNGGFNCLFESSLAGDPHFLLTAEALRTIKCAEATAAFQKAFELFPNSKPPAEVGQRLKLYRRGSGESRGKIDERFWNARLSIEERAAAFIRANAESFSLLDDIPHQSEPSEQISPSSEPSRPRTSAGQLPHWARVLFAARCARHVEQLFDLNWPGASPKRRDSLSRVISLAESSAANGRPADELATALDDLIETGGTALFAIYGHPKKFSETCPPDGNMASVVSSVIKAAQCAGEAAQLGPEKSEGLALEAFSAAGEAAGGDKATVNRMHADRKLLMQVAGKSRWNDATAVPLDVFKSSPSHSKGNKPWWKFW